MGATTRAGLLTSPFRDRFGIVQRLEFYSVDELATIVQASAAKMEVSVNKDGAREIAAVTGHAPDRQPPHAPRARLRAGARGRQDHQAVPRQWLDQLDVDQEGFDQLDRKLLDTVLRISAAGPVGLDSLAVAISEEKDTIEDVLEPYLIRKAS